MSPSGVSVRDMSETPAKPEGFGQSRAWLYDGGSWSQIAHPIVQHAGSTLDELALAGYLGPNNKQVHPVVEVAYFGPDKDKRFSVLSMWAREQFPQCLINLVWGTEAYTLFAARFPEGLDLMARWAPIFQQSGPPAIPGVGAGRPRSRS
jgi:hypothetical protein